LSKIVLDASVALAWCFPDESSTYADEVYDALAQETVLVPALWGTEVVNGILIGERKKRIKMDDLVAFTSLLAEMSIVEEPQPLNHQLQQVLPLARQHGLTAYDACYLELAFRHRVPLATLDVSLQKAANSMAVSLFPH
jgi:predicted nucleic acid-binding protein